MFARTAPATPKLSRFKLFVVFGVTVLGLALFWHQIQHINLRDVAQSFGQISAWQWLGAACAAAASFAALGQYDSLWHRALGTNVPAQTARRTGMAAIAIGQTLGMASFVAGLVRWHRLPDLAPSTILKLSAAVSLSFMICWAVLALPALWMMMGASQHQAPSLWIIAPILAAMAYAGRRICSHHGVPVAMALAMLGWTCLDLTCAALVLYVVLPDSVPLATLISAVIIAMGAGLISNTPGGIGTFDLALMALLPGVAPAALITALLAYRLIYILIPFTIAAASLIRQPLRGVMAPPSAPAAWALAPQSGAILGQSNWTAFMGHTILTPVAIGAPIGPISDWSKDISAVYKCDAKTATHLRHMGWATARIAVEARLNPQGFDTAGRKFQSLRRKLRKADKAGVTIRAGQPRIDEAARVAKAWARDHGGELGFSMGRFTPDLVAAQRVFLIVQDNDLKGFITFHANHQGWALDLIRYLPELPDGAMQAAMITAIETAKAEGIQSLCLGAVPSFTGRLARFDRARAGLLQFKRSFAPSWHPVYHAARTPVWFAITGITVTWAIQRPIANLPYQPFIIKVMRGFHLLILRARGIGRSITKGPRRDDQCTDNVT